MRTPATHVRRDPSFVLTLEELVRAAQKDAEDANRRLEFWEVTNRDVIEAVRRVIGAAITELKLNSGNLYVQVGRRYELTLEEPNGLPLLRYASELFRAKALGLLSDMALEYQTLEPLAPTNKEALYALQLTTDARPNPFVPSMHVSGQVALLVVIASLIPPPHRNPDAHETHEECF